MPQPRRAPLAALRSLHALARGLLDLALPRVCLICDRLTSATTSMLCAECWAALPVLPHPRCDRCGHPTYDDACRWCVLIPPVVTACRSVCWVPEGVGGEIVHKLKYDGWTGLGNDIASRIAPLPRPWAASQRPVLVPVPLGAARRRERGFNQSAIVGRALAVRWRIPMVEAAVQRVRETESQVRLTHDERSANVHEAFAAGSAADALRGKHAVLVDDVVTTAATLNACAAAAVAAGALTVSYVTFGRARAAFDRVTHPRSEPQWQFGSASTDSAASAGRSFAPQKSEVSPTSTSLPSTT